MKSINKLFLLLALSCNSTHTTQTINTGQSSIRVCNETNNIATTKKAHYQKKINIFETSNNVEISKQEFYRKVFTNFIIGISSFAITTSIFTYYNLVDNLVKFLATIALFLLSAYTLNYQLDQPIENIKTNILKANAWFMTAVFGMMASACFQEATQHSFAIAGIGASLLLITSGMFGYFTQRDLTQYSNMLMLASISMIFASLLSIILAWSWVDMILASFSIALSTGYIAYNCNLIKQAYTDYNLSNIKNNTVKNQLLETVGIIAALQLAMDTANIFIQLTNMINRSKQ